MAKVVEEFSVKIEREGKFFVVLIKYSDGQHLATQGLNIFEAYDMLADILKLRAEDNDALLGDKE